MPGDKDYRQMNILLHEVALKIEAAMSGQTNIKDYATGNIRQLALEKLTPRAERLNAQTHGHQQTFDGRTQRRVVIDNEDHLINFRHNQLSWLAGRVN